MTKKSKNQIIGIGIIGTGGMANWHAEKFKSMRGCKLAAGCDLDQNRLDAFTKRFGIPRSYADSNELLADPEVDAVAIVTPDAFHAPLSIAALKAGKHVLCEKPLATNYKDARKMVVAAEKSGLVNMVNFSYRRSSALRDAKRRIERGELGQVVHFEASYLQSWLSTNVWGDWRTNPAWLWRQSTAHGSMGALGDVGVHILDFATYPTCEKIKSVNCKLKTFNNLKGKKKAGYTLDANDSALIRCELAGGGIGVIHTTRWATGHQNSLRLRIYCEKGAIEVDLDKSWEVLRICHGPDIHKAEWKEIERKHEREISWYFIKAINGGEVEAPDFERGAEIQKALDACFQSDAEDRTINVG